MFRNSKLLRSIVAAAAGWALLVSLMPAALADTSTDSTLTALQDSSCLLSPHFDPTVTSYSIALPACKASVTLTPTAAAGATFTMDGAAVASQTYTLDYGKTAASTIEVTAQDGVSKTTYAVSISRAMPGASKLLSLGNDTGTLNPAFDPFRSIYTLTLPDGVSSVTLKPVPASPDAKVYIKDKQVGSDGKIITLGQNEKKQMVHIRVVAPNHVVFVYNVTVQRAPGTVDTLKSLTVGGCTLSPAFDPSVLSYTVVVPYNKPGAKILAVPADRDAKVTINGHKDNRRLIEVAPASYKDIVIKVVAAAGGDANTQTYTVRLIRAPRILSFSAKPKESGTPVVQAGQPLTFFYKMDRNGGNTTIEINVGGTWQTILTRTDAAGKNAYVWDGTLSGTAVAPGAYQVRITSTFMGAASNVKTIAILAK